MVDGTPTSCQISHWWV